MATDNNIKHFTAADIEKYHKGQLSAKERHDLEKAALDDPFLADALEGYAVAGVNASADIDELKKKLAEKVEGTKVVSMHPGRKFWTPFLRAAAMIVVLAGAGLLVYQFAFNDKKAEVAQVKTTKEEVKAPDSISGNTTSTFKDQTPGTTTTTSTDQVQPPVKDNKTTTAGAKGQNEVLPGAAATETRGETDKPADETKPVSGAGDQPVVSAPVKAAEKTESLERSGGSITDKGLVKEDVKTKAPAATKKREADKDVMRDEAATQQSDDSKNSRAFTFNKQADDQNYRRQQMNTFRGRVTDGANTGLPFANVTNVQDNVGTYTDANGNFVLTSADSVLNVQIRSLGYDNNNIQLRNDIAGNKVVMQEDKSLAQIVIPKGPNSKNRPSDNNRKLIEPEPKDGWEKYDSYLANPLNVPEDFKQQKANDNNSVEVSFEVDKNGEPVNIRVEKSLCSSCDKEAIRLVKEGPKWRRNASKKGRTTVTINF
ncbi:MAG: carboxypeptidase-like regulatory domain-containing protein [Bacteroidota bacterium]